jgi:hypothetical protein
MTFATPSINSPKGLGVFLIVSVVFVIGCAVALLEWWRGPEIPRR